MAYCLTGVSATLVSTDASGKFTTTEAWKITSISGLGRSVAVIDNSDLSIAVGAPKQYCFAAIHDLRPITVGVKVDPDDTDVFPNAATTDGSVPVPLGDVASGGEAFVLTLPTVSGNATDLTFSGAVIDDSGIPLVNNDRLRSTFQIQPDGVTFSWAGNA